MTRPTRCRLGLGLALGVRVRARARKEKDYDTADALQAELKALGLYVDDKKRTYGAARPKKGTYA